MSLTAINVPEASALSREASRKLVDRWSASAFGDKFPNTRGYIAERRDVLEALIADALDREYQAGRDRGQRDSAELRGGR
jgi:hypothetical protein